MIKDKCVRDRLCELGLDDTNSINEYTKKIENLESLLSKTQLILLRIEENLKEAREYRKLLKIPDDFIMIETLDGKINKLSNKKILLDEKINEIYKYIEEESEHIKNEKEY
jgi:protein subunit release factor A